MPPSDEQSLSQMRRRKLHDQPLIFLHAQSMRSLQETKLWRSRLLLIVPSLGPPRHREHYCTSTECTTQ